MGQTAEIHLGPKTVLGVVQDVSAHGMGLVLPGDVRPNVGDLIWVVVQSVASYAITGTVRRIAADGQVGIELEEVLSGEALDAVQQLPLADPDQYHATEDLTSS